jgi:threonine dehydrogenase-like Zn-dependent dehydrogenase
MRVITTQLGKIIVAERDVPELPAGYVRIKTEYSAISPGTEMSMLKRTSNQAIDIGYSAVGVVEEIGEGGDSRLLGQRVACYGAPYVHHAEWLTVPTNLIAPVPDHVSPKEAAFAGLGAIAIHALRVADLKFGESVVVVGLGILGNIIAQISNAAAYETAGIDLNHERVGMLVQQGLTHVYEDDSKLDKRLAEATCGVGVDAVILCASGSGEVLINRALERTRLRGKVVIVGDISMEFSRELMFGKEAQVLISRAAGPGRYDVGYEKENRDYPIGYVRWTEGRNIAEYIRLLAEGRISVKPLITDMYPLERAAEAYANYEKPTRTIGTLIKY